MLIIVLAEYLASLVDCVPSFFLHLGEMKEDIFSLAGYETILLVLDVGDGPYDIGHVCGERKGFMPCL